MSNTIALDLPETYTSRSPGNKADDGACSILSGTDAMARKVRRVPVSLDSSGVSPLSEEEIRTILRGADELIMSGGRSLLARVLKGSKQKAVLEKELDRSPVYWGDA